MLAPQLLRVNRESSKLGSKRHTVARRSAGDKQGSRLASFGYLLGNAKKVTRRQAKGGLGKRTNKCGETRRRAHGEFLLHRFAHRIRGLRLGWRRHASD